MARAIDEYGPPVDEPLPPTAPPEVPPPDATAEMGSVMPLRPVVPHEPPPEIVPPMVPSNLRDPDNPYSQVYVPPPEVPTQMFGRYPAGSEAYGPLGVRGRATPERLGVDQSMGGMPQPADRTFMTSDQLVRAALADLPPVFAQFANRHIGRFESTGIYGPPTSLGGYYSAPPSPERPPGSPITPTPPPTQQSVNVGRGVEQVEGPLNAVNAARHELLHALSYESKPFAGDAQQGFPMLRLAVSRSVASLQAPQMQQTFGRILSSARAGDWDHVFTELADMSIRGMVMPPALQQYFAPMYARPIGNAPPSAPPGSR